MAKEMVRWPGVEFPILHKEFERFFEGFPLDFPISAAGDWTPAMDVSETKKGYKVKAELPAAVDEKDIHAKYTYGVLTVTLPKSEEVRKQQVEIKFE